MSNKHTFQSLGMSSQLIRDLIAEKSSITPLVNTNFSQSKIDELAKNRQFSKTSRQVLVDALTRQNDGIQLSAATKNNITALAKEQTYTITTGHQLNLVTGPLYTLYKIAEVISRAKAFNAAGHQEKLVPVFWMATEDHDFDEINHINLYGDQLAWTHGSTAQSVVGRNFN